MEKKETERGKKESGDENQSTKKLYKIRGYVCVCKNECICNTLEHPPTVTLSPSRVEILSSTAKDPSKIPESVARCHGHHEWHKRMSWASAYPNDNPSGESDAWLPFWWMFFVAHLFLPAQGWTTFLKVASKSKWFFFGTPPPKREWDEFGSIRHADTGDRLRVKNPYRSLGFVILAKQGCWVFSEKNKGKWPYNCIGYGYIQ